MEEPKTYAANRDERSSVKHERQNGWRWSLLSTAVLALCCAFLLGNHSSQEIVRDLRQTCSNYLVSPRLSVSLMSDTFTYFAQFYNLVSASIFMSHCCRHSFCHLAWALSLSVYDGNALLQNQTEYAPIGAGTCQLSGTVTDSSMLLPCSSSLACSLEQGSDQMVGLLQLYIEDGTSSE